MSVSPSASPGSASSSEILCTAWDPDEYYPSPDRTPPPEAGRTRPSFTWEPISPARPLPTLEAAMEKAVLTVPYEEDACSFTLIFQRSVLAYQFHVSHANKFPIGVVINVFTCDFPSEDEREFICERGGVELSFSLKALEGVVKTLEQIFPNLDDKLAIEELEQDYACQEISVELKSLTKQGEQDVCENFKSPPTLIR